MNLCAEFGKDVWAQRGTLLRPAQAQAAPKVLLDGAAPEKAHLLLLVNLDGALIRTETELESPPAVLHWLV